MQSIVHFYWDGSCRKLEKDISENSWIPRCLLRALSELGTYSSVMDISAAHFEKQSETSVGEEQSRKPDIDCGDVNFVTVSTLLSFILVREVQNLQATAQRLTPFWMANP